MCPEEHKDQNEETCPIERMPENVYEVITERIEFPKPVVQGKGDPAQRLVGPHVEGGKHPPQVFQRKSLNI
ncbi:hypothetical protein CO110_03660 [Candidatus Desantisbacteria bacterium CG_4_9_14_3_um_filter_40_11]|uniref:Uncharacterized protein n=1 Tax=Candidatus Desantisbacteria bacterium CG_4_9_14_3_um_filter_40_11 TaxID=1974546 RepID=A0A2M8AUK4_9BACT|nr:MAG: hypothetical protein CO110_03660 [Candidatus Desantisbacteria bacterium CG_4_9_14_3_um_filter_40_11]